jgi:hypothetical protein
MVKLDAELCGVIGRSYIKELILKLGYLTVVAGFCRLISQVDKPAFILFPSFCRLRLILF